MKLSISLRPRLFVTAGTLTLAMGANDHQFSPFKGFFSFFAMSALILVLGSGAPIFTHWVKSAISSADNFPFGGIFKSPSYRIAFTNKLNSGFPGTTAGPVSPPRATPSLVSRAKPPLAFLSAELWHLMQFSTKAGRIFFSKNSKSRASSAFTF